jgi:hypothetical protein
MDAFAISLVAGIVLIFIGFLMTTSPASPPVVEPWYPPTAHDDRPVAPGEGRPVEPTDGEPVAPAKATSTGAASVARDLVLDLDEPRAGSPRLN